MDFIHLAVAVVAVGAVEDAGGRAAAELELLQALHRAAVDPVLQHAVAIGPLLGLIECRVGRAADIADCATHAGLPPAGVIAQRQRLALIRLLPHPVGAIVQEGHVQGQAGHALAHQIAHDPRDVAASTT
jgi:hypothetical protein